MTPLDSHEAVRANNTHNIHDAPSASSQLADNELADNELADKTKTACDLNLSIDQQVKVRIDAPHSADDGLKPSRNMTAKIKSPSPRHVENDGVEDAAIRKRPLAEGEVSIEALEQFAYRHGRHYDSYLVTEPKREYFWSADRSGLISFARRGKFLVVGGGLVAPEASRETLLREFLDYLQQNHLVATFHNIENDELPLFRKYGFQVSKWGEEPVMELANLTFSGKPYEWVRRQVNYCKRHEVVAYEVRLEDLTPYQWSRMFCEMLEISAECLTTKPQIAEMKFFEGRIDNHSLGLRRLFVARSEGGTGRLEGFVVCNPLLDGTAWSTELYRHRLDGVRGTTAFLFHHLMTKLRDEGVREIRMCLDAGFGCDKRTPGDSFLIRGAMNLTQKYCSAIFDIAGIRHFKSRFRPRYEERFCCAWPKSSVRSVWAFLSVFGVLDVQISKVIGNLWRNFRHRAARKNLASPD